jgi:hypothetical protein
VTRVIAPARRSAPHPYVDIELCFEAGEDQLTLVRSVAAEIARREGVQRAYVERVRTVVGQLTTALMALAEGDAQVRCLFRVLESEIRVRVSVPGCPRPTPEAKSQHARVLDRMTVSTSTVTLPHEDGGFMVVSDAFVPFEEDGRTARV